MGRDRGITLIELVVAMSLFALVAVMGIQAITGQLSGRDRVLDADKRTSELALGLTLLRADMAAVVPVGFAAPDGELRSVVAAEADGDVVEISMTIAGQAAQTDPRPVAFHRVLWRWDTTTGELRRSYWSSLAPDARSEPRGDVVLFRDVRDLNMQLFVQGQGWRSLYPSPEGIDLTASLILQAPDALSLRLDSATHGRLKLLEALE
ncbi:prepilin-type N-terminal cleavage/methylation domain-containing protein [Primorskyibacter aestuariivivens]|uniref:type II secretion system protein GspJ n=1 Tax=Primorskyibacter aestuariivivens TaxID=1888912 RepID=UPI002300C096|nr:type II secretion system protein GspJ [Primorskyibacter aestuariivivens]MDA7426914.1 prepilin-type N-terminal cleavage/methylation domain-containing protein [Primorskyibacter aestuariivivens]